MQFIKTREVKSPVRNVNENAGIDFYVPTNTSQFVEDLLKKNPLTVDIRSESWPEAHKDKDGYRNRLEWIMESKVNFVEDGKIYIAPHKDIIIPSGIRSKFGPHLALIANNKSGIATKKKLVFGASVIDASYQGEWHLHLINTSDSYQFIECDTKVVQFIPHLISTEEVEVVDQTPEEFYKDSTSSRGEGWQGSTGVK